MPLYAIFIYGIIATSPTLYAIVGFIPFKISFGTFELRYPNKHLSSE